jgi:hypothetical protein
MTFINALKTELNNTTTENGAKAYSSTMNNCLDLFAKIAACRDNLEMARRHFDKAYAEHPETAIRILFWSRDIRGGQGERSIFRYIMENFALNNPSVAAKIVSFIPEYGRWDDLMSLENTPLWSNALDLIKKQFTNDKLGQSANRPISLLAKWLPSINASSKDSKRLGRKIASYLGLNEKEYRKELVALRNYLNIVETPMCSNEWSVIDYSRVPSRASFMYRKAFAKHDQNRYSRFLQAVEKGEAKINASTLYPYDIVNEYLYKGAKNDKTIDLQWKALPNYMEGRKFNGLVVADVSGSMKGMPMAVSISLAMYIAERNESPVWKNKFLTFAASPQMLEITGNTIGQQIRNLEHAPWGGNTDLMATFNLILNTATSHSVAPEDMPQTLIIVSDMQFDVACKSNKRTNFEQIKKLYNKSGYELPQLVFWNVRSGDNVPVKYDDTGTCIVSGCSPTNLTTVLGDSISPIDVMMKTVYSERYNPIGEVIR